MKSKASYFSISVPLIKENFRRFWAIPVLSFLVYFFSFPFQVIMSYGHLNELSLFIGNALLNHQIPIMFAHGVFPAIAAVIVFRYLQSTSSATVMHAMPFSRNKLFNSNGISGLLLVLIPFLLNGLILLALSKPVFSMYEGQNVFARTDILVWMGESVVIICFVYAISVFAGIVTGNMMMHFAMAGLLNFVVPGLLMLFSVYFQQFVFGFRLSESFYSMCADMTPYLKVMEDGGSYSALSILAYLAVTVIVLVISSLLYGKRKLERTGDSLVFAFMQPVICYIIAFAGMSLMGFYFTSFSSNSNYSVSYLYLGFAAGALLFFMIGQMIVKKTPRIFNKKGLRDFGIFAVIACLFLLCINIDVLGYEKKIPPVETVASVSIPNSFPEGVSNLGVGGNDSGLVELKDPKNIEAFIRFHRSVIENRQQFFKSGNAYYDYKTAWVPLEYQLKNQKTVSREYNGVSQTFVEESSDLKEIFTSKEYKEAVGIKSKGFGKILTMSLHTVGSLKWEEQEARTIHTNDMAAFIDCIDADFKAQTYEEMRSMKRPYIGLELVHSYHSEANSPLQTDSIDVSIPKSYRKTIAWLQSKGYDVGLLVTAADVSSIQLYKTEDGVQFYEDGSMQSNVGIPSGELKDREAAGQKAVVITDKGQIQEILDTCKTNSTHGKSYYYGRIIGTDQNIQDDSCYYDFEDAPNFVTKLFK